ncbi:response regulator [Aerosakkonemataceae cyanobacterium BLCC-F154]|uniref:Response regulator n=1 Tax=Floridaenema fluviatile BLCC-F154 TaxID=3153640 RepID=A0ABV4Y8S2_9CYAN
MNKYSPNFTILMANDDRSVHLLVEEALQEIRLAVQIFFVNNGEELLDYLYSCGDDANLTNLPTPHLILLDLNMPKLNGKEVLTQLKSNSSNWRHIPIVIFTTSHQEGDIRDCYNLGANSFIVKPMTFDRLVTIMNDLFNYWFKIVSLPPGI